MSETSRVSIPIWAWPVALFVGASLVNAIPHGVMGMTGHAFPTPFSGGPPDLSLPWVNVVWSLINIAIGLGLGRLLAPWRKSLAVRATVAVAAAAFALILSFVFAGVTG